MPPRRRRWRFARWVIYTLVPPLLLAVGTVGYVWIEGWDWFDALYMSVITLTTVGYQEVHQLSTAGKAFTMAFLLTGVFLLFYVATGFIRAAVSGEIAATLGRQRMERNLAGLKDHVIVCGLGKMGRLVCRELAHSRIPLVVIEKRAALLEGAHFHGGVKLHGDATSDEVLKQAGVARARALIAVVASDADNLYITMSARLLSEELFIVARASDEQAEAKLLRAGA